MGNATTVFEILRQLFKDRQTALDALLNGGADVCDFIVTFIRNGIVWGNVQANNTNDDSHNNNSSFNKTLYNDGSPESGLTPAGWGAIGTSVGAFFLGFVRSAYKLYRKLKLTSYDHLRKKVQPFSNKPITNKDLIAGLDDLLNRGKVAGTIFEDGKLKASPTQYSIDESSQRQIRLKKSERDTIETFDIKDGEDATQPKLHPVFRFINKITSSKVGHYTKELWDFMNQNSYVFWIGWFPLMIALGIVAVSTSPALAALSLIPAVVFTLGNGIWKFASWVKSKVQKNKEIPEHYLSDAEQDDLVIRRLVQRYFTKKEHADHLSQLANANEKLPLDADRKQAIKTAATKIGINMAIGLKAKQTRKSVLESDLGKYLLGSPKERRARLVANVIKDAASGYAGAAFILWFVSTLLLAPVGLPFLPTVIAVALSAGSTALGGGILGAAACGAVGFFFGTKTIAAQKKREADYQEEIYRRLSAPYKPDGEKQKSNGIKISKLEMFEQLEASINTKKEAIKTLRSDLLRHDKSLKNDTKKKILFDYNLDNINVYNNDYFEKQRQKPGFWTYLKKGGNRLYEFLGGGQTWVFIARTLFLATCIGGPLIASAFIGGPIAFLAVAAAIGIVGGCARLVQYHLEQKQKHKENFTRTIDDRISKMRKDEKELIYLEQLLRTERGMPLENSVSGNEQRIQQHDSQRKSQLGNESDDEITIAPPDQVVGTDGGEIIIGFPKEGGDAGLLKKPQRPKSSSELFSEPNTNKSDSRAPSEEKSKVVRLSSGVVTI